MSDNKVVAKKSDWTTEDMPKETASFKLKRAFTAEELANLRLGNIPREMEDKWFWYMEGDTLYAHRSWTGHCIYIVEINVNTGVHNVTVNRDKYQYSCTDIGEDIDQLNTLLNWWVQTQYDYYNEWLEETVTNLNKASDSNECEETDETIESMIYLNQGDITKLDCDCIVNAANESLLGGGGVDGAIHRAAGPELLRECRTLHGCETGEAKITKGYNLPAKYVIHTVGPIYSGKPSDADMLAACYRNSLNLAKDNDIRSIAFPAISAGAYGYPLQEATKIAVETVCDWIAVNLDYAMDIVFCCFDKKTYDVYDSIISRMLN